VKLRANQLAASLGRQLPPILMLSGDEPLQLNECADLVRRQAIERGYAERIVLESQRGFNWGQLAAESANRSLFAQLRLFDLRLHSNAIGKDGSKAICDWCAHPPADSLLLVTAAKLDSGQARSKWVKMIEQTGHLVQIWPIDANQLAGWLEQRMRDRGMLPQRGVCALLAERVEGNLLAAAQEIEKLLLIKGPGQVTVEQLLEGVADSARYNAFTLVDEMLAGKAMRCVRILAGLRAEGEPPALVLWAMARELRGLHGMARQLVVGDSMANVMAGGRVWAKRRGLMEAALRRLTVMNIQQGLLNCQHADAAIKGMNKQDPWLLFEQTCLGLCTPGRRAGAA
jgi:DNA polymerase-3 subunit delta